MGESRATEQGGQLLAGRYRLEAEIARGAIGTVWRARDLRTGEPVAVKVLLPEAGHDPDVVNSLLAEAAILAELKHPSIVGAVDVVANGLHALVMDLVEGVDVRQRIRRSGPLRPAEVAEIGAQVADALAAVHAADIVHGDVKPGNILVPGDGGPVKLGDFGVARRIQLPDTVTHATPEYVSPEVVAGAKPLPSSDVYSLGMVLYEMTCGRSPYRGGSVGEVIERHSSCVPVQPAGMPDELWSLVLRCVEPDPAARPAAAQLAAELRRLAPTLVGRPSAAMLPEYAKTYRPRLMDPADPADPAAPRSPAVPMAGAVVSGDMVSGDMALGDMVSGAVVSSDAVSAPDGPLWPENPAAGRSVPDATPSAPPAGPPADQSAAPSSAAPSSALPDSAVPGSGEPVAGPVSGGPVSAGPAGAPSSSPAAAGTSSGNPAGAASDGSVLALFDKPGEGTGGPGDEATAVVGAAAPVPPQRSSGGSGKVLALVAVAAAVVLLLGIGAGLLIWSSDDQPVARRQPAPAPSKTTAEPEPTRSAKPSPSESPEQSPSTSPTEPPQAPPGGGDDGTDNGGDSGDDSGDGRPGLGDPMPTMPG